MNEEPYSRRKRGGILPSPYACVDFHYSILVHNTNENVVVAPCTLILLIYSGEVYDSCDCCWIHFFPQYHYYTTSIGLLVSFSVVVCWCCYY